MSHLLLYNLVKSLFNLVLRLVAYPAVSPSSLIRGGVISLLLRLPLRRSLLPISLSLGDIILSFRRIADRLFISIIILHG